MKPGETVETAIWIDGTETPEQMERFRGDAARAMLSMATAQGVALTPLRWTSKRPGDDRVPDVPDHIQGPDVRLLVAEADAVEGLAVKDISRFLADLAPRDLARLRRVTRDAYGRQFPGRQSLSNRQTDTLINDLGPTAALASLESGRMFIQ